MEDKEKNLEERVENLEESIRILLNMNQNQIQTILYALDKIEQNLNSLLFKQI